MTRLVRIAATAIASLLSNVAFAQAPGVADAPRVPLGAAPVSSASDAANGDGSELWLSRYSAARERMLAGAFAEAAPMFRELVATAPSPVERAAVLEDERTCEDWARRELVLVRRADLGESSVGAKRSDVRTNDEIAALYTSAVVYGLGTGLWLDVQTESNSPAGVVLPALGFAGASAGVVALLDSGRPLRYGVAQSIVAGMTIGFEEGLVLTTWNQARVERADEWSGKTMVNVVWGLSTAGAIAGGVIGTERGTTPGRASFVGSAALWSGTVAGLMGASLTSIDEKQDDNGLLAAAIGLNAGAVVGALAAGPVSPSIARVRFLDLGGLSGGLLFGGLYLAAADRNPDARAAMVTTAAGIAAGLGVAWGVTSEMTPDRREDAALAAKPRIVSSVAPTLAPVAGGATLGVAGTL